jgi:hypothetical protein
MKSRTLMFRGRVILLGAFLVMASVPFTAGQENASLPATFAVHELTFPGSFFVMPNGINARGDIVGTLSFETAPNTIGFLRRNGCLS